MIGTAQAFALACGFLFVTLYAGNLNGVDSLLFGSFLGITTSQVVVLAVVAAVGAGVLAAIGRPLLFASVDPEVAAGRGVPVRALSVAFLVLLGRGRGRDQPDHRVAAGVRAARAAGGHRPGRSPPARRAASALAVVDRRWPSRGSGLAVAYFSPYPIGFWVTTRRLRGLPARPRWRGRRSAAPSGADGRRLAR